MLDPKQRAALMALRARLQPFRESLRQLGAELETAIVQEEAVALALEERLGHEPQDGELILPEDDLRAERIVAQHWGRFE